MSFIHSIKFRFTIWYLIVLMLLIGALSVGVYFYLSHSLHQNLDRSLEVRATQLKTIRGVMSSIAMGEFEEELGEVVLLYLKNGEELTSISARNVDVTLDSALVQKALNGEALYAIIFNRITSELVKRNKRVDALIIRDALCGTLLRPCPKYARTIDLDRIAPDIFLFPQRVPNLDDPKPPVHSLDTLRLPRVILDLFGVRPRDYSKHLWEVYVEVFVKTTRRGERTARRTTVYHKGKKLEERESYV